MTMIGSNFPVREKAFWLRTENRNSVHPEQEHFDVFSPAPGDSKVIK
jgi:hypothetical protein